MGGCILRKMRSKRDRLITFIIGVIAVTAFVVTSFVALVWANGLSFDLSRRNFQQTALIAVEARINKASITVNGDEVATAAPFQHRSLPAGRYELRITKPGYREYVKIFQLTPGQVGIVPEKVRLLADNPKSELLALTSPDGVSPFDSGISVDSGELIDRGVLVTRFSSDPLLVRRFNQGYLYQIGNQLRLYFADNNSDELIKTFPAATPAVLTVDETDWRVTIFGVNDAERLSLTEINEALVESN